LSGSAQYCLEQSEKLEGLLNKDLKKYITLFIIFFGTF
jgi:hypothetical protein